MICYAYLPNRLPVIQLEYFLFVILPNGRFLCVIFVTALVCVFLFDFGYYFLLKMVAFEWFARVWVCVSGGIWLKRLCLHMEVINNNDEFLK